ncbi:hypothetical protein DFH09DRAFT_1194094 [Mycena vulgaris]|nr:hypothetical protein DFH09DRAFT_1194094 [Mycena vulgaris]
MLIFSRRASFLVYRYACYADSAATSADALPSYGISTPSLPPSSYYCDVMLLVRITHRRSNARHRNSTTKRLRCAPLRSRVPRSTMLPTPNPSHQPRPATCLLLHPYPPPAPPSLCPSPRPQWHGPPIPRERGRLVQWREPECTPGVVRAGAARRPPITCQATPHPRGPQATCPRRTRRRHRDRCRSAWRTQGEVKYLPTGPPSRCRRIRMTTSLYA